MVLFGCCNVFDLKIDSDDGYLDGDTGSEIGGLQHNRQQGVAGVRRKAQQ